MYLLIVVWGYVVTFTVGEWSSCKEKWNPHHYIQLSLFGNLEPSITRNNFHSEHYIIIFINNVMWLYVLFNFSVGNTFCKAAFAQCCCKYLIILISIFTILFHILLWFITYSSLLEFGKVKSSIKTNSYLSLHSTLPLKTQYLITINTLQKIIEVLSCHKILKMNIFKTPVPNSFLYLNTGGIWNIGILE